MDRGKVSFVICFCLSVLVLHYFLFMVLLQKSFHELSTYNCLKYIVKFISKHQRVIQSTACKDFKVLSLIKISSLDFCFWKYGSLMFEEILPSQTHLTILHKIFFKKDCWLLLAGELKNLQRPKTIRSWKVSTGF